MARRDELLPTSPATRPWIEPLPVYRPKQPMAFPTIATPTGTPGANECGRDDHQAWSLHPPQKYYEMHVRQALHSFHRDLPTQPIWAFDGRYPGPTFHARYGEPIIVRIYNDLPEKSIGFGSPEIATHLHNMHSPSESDGFPSDFFSRTVAGPTFTGPGAYRDHHYVNAYAGGDYREALGTLWYHDHRMDFTAPNNYRGLTGFYLLFDELDSNDENDPNPTALRLPSGEFDVPLLFQDKAFDANGMLAFDQFNTEGLLGDKICVNGKIQPYFRVQPRKYRFRLLDGGPARFYEFVIEHNGQVQTFDYIANDGNLLPAPLQMDHVRLGVAERGDIVVDFSKYPPGSRLFLRNRLEQTRGRGPDENILKPGIPLLRFDVVKPLAAPDRSQVPAELRPLEPLENIVRQARVKRQFRFKKDNAVWVVNDEIFDPIVPMCTPKSGAAEIWELESNGNWSHPVHIHLEEGRIISRDGAPPPPHEQGRKDVYVLHPGEKVKLVIRFRDFVGKYPCHCHNLTHEDHSMMFRFDVVR